MIQSAPKFVTASVLLGLFAIGCTSNRAAAPPPPRIPVVIAKASQKAMPVEVVSVGNVEPISTVSIKALASGELLEVHFKDGDFVHKGQLLFTIDPRPYQHQVGQVQGNIAKDQALLKQAEANLARDMAQDEFARAQSGRYDSLTKKGLIAKDSAEQIKALAGASQESIRADEAAIESAHANINGDQNALESAKLQLSYCTIYSPIDGRTGAVMLKAGNLVKTADVPMVVINQLDPIYVNFTVPQQYWADIKKHMADGSLHVIAAVPQDLGEPKQGAVTFVDNTVDATTGTIHIRATFENSDNRLLPGLFINVTLRLSEELNATVIPLQAITEGQNGTFVYVVKSDNTVEMRTVVSSRSRGGEAVIDKGLHPGELVVIDGQTRLAPNAKVEIKNNLNEAVAP